MARNIHSNYYQDNLVKYECDSCRRRFILGESMSDGMGISCPYCQSFDVEIIGGADEECTAEMQMGCAGLYFHTYPDESLMLYTEREFAAVIQKVLTNGGEKTIPLGAHGRIMLDYCSERDGWVSRHVG